MLHSTRIYFHDNFFMHSVKLCISLSTYHNYMYLNINTLYFLSQQFFFGRKYSYWLLISKVDKMRPQSHFCYYFFYFPPFQSFGNLYEIPTIILIGILEKVWCRSSLMPTTFPAEILTEEGRNSDQRNSRHQNSDWNSGQKSLFASQPTNWIY